jgi:hypothetical protein
MIPSLHFPPSKEGPPFAQGNPSTPPPKYVVIDGVRQYNPDYKTYQERQGQPVTTALHPEKALPIVSNMDQHEELRQASLAAHQGDVPLAKSTDATIDMMQDPDICRKVGLAPDAAVDALGAFFAKHEVPMGLMNKLMGLTEYHRLEFIIDDSGSMNSSSGKNSSGYSQTRWEEAHNQMKTLIEMMSYVPTPEIKICFLNRADVITLQRKGETPDIFMNNAYKSLDQVFQKKPDGRTPVLSCLKKSFESAQSQNVARYLFCDGVPNEGKTEEREISRMLKERPNPQGNPFTFLSCSDQDDDVEWMKTTEELVPYCSEFDDFVAEAKEVCKDQGEVFPFTRGFYLIVQLVAVMNPDDLDAMDESVPFTKPTLDNLLGVKSSEGDYRRYFDGFKQAQQKRSVKDQSDAIKKGQNWEPFFSEFVNTPLAKNINAVKEFKKQLDLWEISQLQIK